MDKQQALQTVQPLFKPFHLGSLTLPNRIVMAPMTRSFSPGGFPDRMSPLITGAGQNRV